MRSNSTNDDVLDNGRTATLECFQSVVMQLMQAQRKFDCRFFLVGIFLLLFALGPGEEPRGDAGARMVITRQLLAQGQLHRSDPHPQLVQTPMGWTSYFGIGQTLLFIPFEIAGKAFSLLPPTAFAPGVRRQFPLTYLYIPLVGVAYFLALVSLLKAFGLSARAAAMASLLFTFCSLSTYYVAQSFQEEAITSVFVCLCLGATLRWRRSGENRHAFEAGLFSASMLLFRTNAIFVFIPLVVLFAQGLRTIGLASLRARQSVGAVLLGALGPAAIHLIFAYLRFGNPFSTGYEFIPLVLWQPLQFEVVMSLLFGLGKGLFIFSPLLAIALWGMWIDRARLALYGIACLVALAGNVLLSACFFAPDGCWSWGPRYQVHLLPLFVYPAWVGMRDLLGRRVGVPIAGVALGLGLLFQLCALLAPDRLEYSQLPITQEWWKIQDHRARMQNIMEGCSVIQQRQFQMRLGNIASVILAVGEGGEIADPALRREFGNLWVVRLGRDLSGWARGAVIFAWLGIVAGAATCLYRSLRRKQGDKKQMGSGLGGPMQA